LGIVVPIGRHGGVGEYQGAVLPSESVRDFKCTDLCTSQIWGDLGLTPPP